MISDKTMHQAEDIKVRLSTLWVVVLFNMVFADIVGFMTPGELEKIIAGDVGIQITQELLLLFSLLLEIPIAMVFLSRVLTRQVNRWTNILAAIITIMFVIGGGSSYLSYLFFASVEVVCLLAIVWFSWRWADEEA